MMDLEEMKNELLEETKQIQIENQEARKDMARIQVKTALYLMESIKLMKNSVPSSVICQDKVS